MLFPVKIQVFLSVSYHLLIGKEMVAQALHHLPRPFFRLHDPFTGWFLYLYSSVAKTYSLFFPLLLSLLNKEDGSLSQEFGKCEGIAQWRFDTLVCFERADAFDILMEIGT
jgi:hypothetical protein